MEVPRHWRLKKQRYGLVGEMCPACEVKIFPPRDICPGCGTNLGPFNEDPYLAQQRVINEQERLVKVAQIRTELEGQNQR